MARREPLEYPNVTPMLDGISWAIAGAVAASHYMPPRATEDFAIVVDDEQIETARERLVAGECAVEAPLSVGGYALRSPSGELVDIIPGDRSWFAEAAAAAANNPDHRDAPVLTLPYLVLMKMIAARSTDIPDLGRMLGLATDAALEDVRRIFYLHLPDETEDLESLITSGRLEFGDDASSGP